MTKENKKEVDSMKQLKIEQTLPVTVTGIESIKETYSESMSPHRKMYKWFARRPTAVTRLAVLSSVLPPEVSNEELLQYMSVGPKQGLNGSIEDYVLKKEATKDSRDGNIEDHFGYDYPHKHLPNSEKTAELHQLIRDHWDGELPTVIDPTAGSGTIPFETSRYGFPAISNELNPVAWLLNKVVLEYAREQGSLDNKVKKWADEIQKEVETELSQFFPDHNGAEVNYYFRAYSTECSSCGKRFPLSNQWWFNRSKRIAVRPKYDGDVIKYTCEEIPENSDFDAGIGTVSGGDAECPHCNVVTERDELISKFKSGDFEFELCGIKYVNKVNGTKYHSPSEEDYDAIKKASEKVESELDLSTILQEDRYIGYYDRAGPYGITKWRDLFSPRQLLVHYTYMKKFEEIKPKIRSQYDDKESEAILTLLSLMGTRLIDYNSRLVPIHVRFGIVADMLGNNNFTFQWNFGETNPLTGGRSYEQWKNHILENYEDVVDYYEDNPGNVDIYNEDASALPLEDESVESVVIDPPYGDNIIYSEVADAFYVWLRKYLQDVFPTEFSEISTNKQDEAVENPSLDTVEETSARERYENKMREIFSESYRILEAGGVITIYFTDKEVSAWDSLTTSLIDAGFTITATHAVSSENPERIGVKGQSSADTSLLLTCRKPLNPDTEGTRVPTLWNDIRQEISHEAKSKATELLDSDTALTKTDIIISAFGPTLRVFTENYPVVDKYDDIVRPKRALENARAAVTEVLVDRELGSSLDGVDSLTKWYILCWLVYDRSSIPYDEANQLGLGVGADIDELKSKTKIWGKSGEKIELKPADYRVRDFTALENGEKRRKRAYPVDPRSSSFTYQIDTVHATLNVLRTKGSEFTWNWIKERKLHKQPKYIQTIDNLQQVLPENHPDYESLINLLSGQTGELLDVQVKSTSVNKSGEDERTTLGDF